MPDETRRQRLERIAATAKQMRAAQRQYFKARDNLDECKRLERQLDEQLKHLDDPPELFMETPDA